MQWLPNGLTLVAQDEARNIHERFLSRAHWGMVTIDLV
jgi:hypothetical protein